MYIGLSTYRNEFALIIRLVNYLIRDVILKVFCPFWGALSMKNTRLNVFCVEGTSSLWYKIGKRHSTFSYKCRARATLELNVLCIRRALQKHDKIYFVTGCNWLCRSDFQNTYLSNPPPKGLSCCKPVSLLTGFCSQKTLLEEFQSLGKWK